MNQAGSYKLLITRLDRFIRKFYLNQLIRGALFTLGGILAMYLFVSFLEYQFYFEPGMRKLLFFGGLTLSLSMLGRLVLRPLMHYFQLGEIIDHNRAAKIIGSHFSEVEDKLLNILQLKEQSGSLADNSLIEASIDQKIDQMQPVPFSMAIDLSKNRKYLKYALPPIAAFLFILFAAPNILRESNTRLIRNGEHFERMAPFAFELNNEKLEVIQYEDFKLELQVDGNALPDQVWIKLGKNATPFRMQKISPARFGYTFHKVAEDQQFYFEANSFRSTDYELEVLPTASLQHFELKIDYPSYTGRKDETIKNTGDVTVPIGTQIDWVLKTKHAEQMGFHFPDSAYFAKRTGENEFQFERTIYSDVIYRIGMGNSRVAFSDTISYRIASIPDLYPTVSVEQFEDSTNRKYLYFLGEAGDDYGLRNLNFVWKWQGEDLRGNSIDKGGESEPINLQRGSKAAFTYSWDLTKKGLQPGDQITYYFEVWDNDGIHGSKSARTAPMVFEMPTMDEFEVKTEKNNDEIKEELEETLKEVDEIQDEIQELREKLMQKKELDWEDKQNLEKLLEKQQKVQKNIENIQENFKENLTDQKEYKKYSEELVKKQEMLQKLFEDVLSQEMKEMIEEMEKLLEELSKEEGLEELEEMELTDEQLENELDRMLELFKQFELEQKMEDVIEKLEDLADQQEELSEETEEAEENKDDKSKEEQKQESEELAEEQGKLNEEFEELREEIDKMEELNQELSEPNDMESTEQMEEEISESMEESEQSLQENKKSEAGEQQEQSSEQMKEMAEQMQSSLSGMQQQQQQEDMQALRQLLDNLIKLSFDQESLMEEFGKVRPQNPRYTELVQEQFKIREDAEMVEDSLLALAKRVFEISTFVTREIAEINRHMDDGIKYLADRKLAEARKDQQYVMTGMNNLALMLDEVLQQMQQAMADAMPGSQMCQNPGKGKPKPGAGQKMKDMGGLQGQLNKQLEQMKKGQKPGGGMNPLSSKEYAQMAAKQSAIRQALEQMAEQMGDGTKEGAEIGKELKEIADAMEGTEEDLVNKIFNNEMLERQQDILTRMLEAEEALEEREISPERKSQTAQEISRDIPPSLEEYLKKRQSEIDLYKTVPANLKPYYKNLVEEYLEGINF